MSPVLTFSIGVVLLILFCWYFLTDIPRLKRIIGTVLTVILVAFCVQSMTPFKDKIRLGLDLEGGSAFLIRLIPQGDMQVTPSMQEEATNVIRKRIDQFGVGEPLISPQGTDRILVQIPGMDGEKIEEARQQLQKVAKLEFKLVHPESDHLIPLIESGEEFIGPDWEIKPYKDDVNGKEVTTKLLVKKRADLEGDNISQAGMYFDNRGYGVGLNFTSAGAKRFAEVSSKNVGNRLAIVLDGEIKSAPVIQTPITDGRATITGHFSEVEARTLSSVLENPLSTPVVIEEERNVSSTLGGDAIQSGIMAGIIGASAVLLFTLVYYQFAGLVAIIGLTVNMVMLFGLMSMFNFVLTLPGIAGAILTIGMAVDANVLIYERLREELHAGKSTKAAIHGAYDKAFSAIFDANITTIITSVILFWLASGSVRGFAVTLTVGITASMFSALLVTRICFGWATESGLLKKIRMFDLVPKKQFDFVSVGRTMLKIAVIATIAAIVAFTVRGKKNFGIDFTGGDLITLKAQQDISEGDVREVLKNPELTIQKAQTAQGNIITIRAPFNTGSSIAKTVQEGLPDAGINVEGIDKVGPLVGKELATNSLFAIALGVLGVFLYVSARFELSFAVSVLIALIHDLIVTIGIMSLLGYEFSLIMVGAVLTIAGYSVNDTIVVFDRIREGLASGSNKSTEFLMNKSINDTLGRTILTGGTSLMSSLALYFFGGVVLREFALAITIGVLIGTYSSVYIAAPLVLWWSKLRGHNLHSQVRKTEEARAATN